MEIDVASDERLMRSGRCRYFAGDRYVSCDIHLTDKRIVVSSISGEYPSVWLDVSLTEMLDTWRSLKEEPASTEFVIRTAGGEFQFLLDDPQDWRAALGQRLGITKGPAALPHG
jgi:hypothetical protein